MVIEVYLDAEELIRANDLARQRNDKPASWSHRFSNHADFDIHLMGTLAEVAWEKLTGWPMDATKRLDGDSGIDFVYEGRTYQVKTASIATHNEPGLICRVDYARANRFILSWLNLENPERVIFVGWCTRQELISSAVRDFGYGDRYYISHDDLRPITKELIENVRV